MLIDFHAHIASKDTIFCTDLPSGSASEVLSPKDCLMSCEGLLPDKWTAERQTQLQDNLKRDPFLQLGEVGLDRRFSETIPIQDQADNLISIMTLALSLERTITLHCVRQTGLMLEILSSLEFPYHGILWHGFTGSKETASRLNDLGVIISINPRTKTDLRSLFSANQNLVLETDYVGASQSEHSALLSDHYSRCASELKISVTDLEKHCSELFASFRNPFKEH